MGIYFDFRVLVILIMLGAVIKHTSALRKINNKFIPYILIPCGVLLVFLVNAYTFNIDTIVTGIITSSTAVGIHQQGKISFISIADKITASTIKAIIGDDISKDETNKDDTDI